MKKKIEDGLYCCGKKLTGEDGINGGLYFYCKKCGKGFNVIWTEGKEVKE